MFTGIIESIGRVVSISKEQLNLKIVMKSAIAAELRPDQSVSHNGVCLTVTEVNGDEYTVVAIDETLKRSNLGLLKPGDEVNLERALKIGDRLDGHLVQGHVDEMAVVKKIEKAEGSTIVFFDINPASGKLIIQKGSICINGVSLTVVHAGDSDFSTAIIPYTFDHTNFHSLRTGDKVNLEYDMIGKYIQRMRS